MLAKNASTPGESWPPALSLTIFASKRAPTVDRLHSLNGRAAQRHQTTLPVPACCGTGSLWP
ncbi:hypothetical protein CWC48_01860 [Pseudomonas sp. S10E 269]|nr:hypothetical protein CWC49_12020 [Pseudomonas sp. S09F 262]PJK37915.1 hypothetical protein CWC48_01860 [Pseudomonas sp. S10E 269]